MQYYDDKAPLWDKDKLEKQLKKYFDNNMFCFGLLSHIEENYKSSVYNVFFAN